MKKEPDHLFVYGTLRQRAAHPMARYLWREATYVGAATAQGRLYRVAHYPGATPSDDPSDKIIGALFRLHRRTTLGRLDRYEGCAPDDPKPHLYRREAVTVTDVAGRPFRAWIYFYNRPLGSAPRIESGDYLAPYPPPPGVSTIKASPG